MNFKMKRNTKRLEKIATQRKAGGFADIWHRLKKNKPAVAGLVIISIFLFCAIFADFIVDFNGAVITQNSAERLQAPSMAHWFGTDGYGRDIFSRIVYGSRSTLTIAFATTAAACLAGGLLGALAGYYGGMVDNVIMRIVDTIMCLPPMLFSLSIVAALGAGVRNLVIAVSVTMTPYFVRVVRAAIMTVAGSDYIEAARACGSNDTHIIMRHIFPNSIGPIIVQATMSVSFIIMLAAGLSFIGLGVQPPLPEWGAMLSEGREYMRYSVYIVGFPGLAIVLSALSLNLFGDGLRDALDPRLKD